MSTSAHPSIHVASLVVHARPERADVVVAAIEALDGAEVHGMSELGKVVVTLETGDEAGLVARIDAINAIAGVLSAALVFHQVEDLDE